MGVAVQHIIVVSRCDRRTRLGGWIPAFRLCIVEGSLLRLLPEFSAATPGLTFLTRTAAEWWGERQAREWCSRNYPGLPVHSNRIARPRPT